MKHFVIFIDPASERLVAMKAEMTPARLQRMLDTPRPIAHRELCIIDGKPLRYVRAHYPSGNDGAARWQLGAADPVAGRALLVGMEGGKASSCPVELEFVRRNMTWLPSIAAERAKLAEVQQGLDRLSLFQPGDPENTDCDGPAGGGTPAL